MLLVKIFCAVLMAGCVLFTPVECSAGHVFQGDVQYYVAGPNCAVVVRHNELRNESEALKASVYGGIRECAQDFANIAVQGSRLDQYSLGETRFDGAIHNSQRYVSAIMDGYPPRKTYYRTFYKATGECVVLTDFLPRDVLTKECFNYAIDQGWIEKYNFDPYYSQDILSLDTDDFYVDYNGQMIVVFTDRSKPSHHFLGSLIFKINTSDYVRWVREWRETKKYQVASAQDNIYRKTALYDDKLSLRNTKCTLYNKDSVIIEGDLYNNNRISVSVETVHLELGFCDGNQGGGLFAGPADFKFISPIEVPPNSAVRITLTRKLEPHHFGILKRFREVRLSLDARCRIFRYY